MENSKEIETKILTEIEALSMLTQKYCNDNEVASYAFGMVNQMLLDIKQMQKSG